MALRDQPYIPMYVQDFMTDEKLMECSALATGVYIRLMCILHKQKEYGVILLKQKYKQTDKQVENFASQIAKYMPYDKTEIRNGLNELVDEKVLQIEGDKLMQKRMVKDNHISEVRANAGKKGGIKTQFAKAKTQANSEYENENENEIINNDAKKIPKLEEFVKYALEQNMNVSEKAVELKYKAWRENSWRDGNDKPIKNWKTKLLNTLQYLSKNETSERSAKHKDVPSGTNYSAGWSE